MIQATSLDVISNELNFALALLGFTKKVLPQNSFWRRLLYFDFGYCYMRCPRIDGHELSHYRKTQLGRVLKPVEQVNPLQVNRKRYGSFRKSDEFKSAAVEAA